MANPLTDNAEFFLKSATPQKDHSIVCELVCPLPGEGGPDGPFQITIAAEEFKPYPEIVNNDDGTIAVAPGAKPAALEAVFRAILEPKVSELAKSLRPPVDVAAAMIAALHSYEPVVEVEPAKPGKIAVVDDAGKPVLDAKGKPKQMDVVISAITTGGEYNKAKAFIA